MSALQKYISITYKPYPKEGKNLLYGDYNQVTVLLVKKYFPNFILSKCQN